MKTVVCMLVLAMLFGGSVAFCQVEKGSWEMSLAATFGSVSTSRDGDEGESTSLLSVAFRPGYYVIDGLSIEPELFWTAIESERPMFSLAANASYTFRPSDANVSPFLLAGYGIGNGIPTFQRLMFRASDEMDVSVLNLGGGVKYFLSKDIGLRAEYRYQRFHQEEGSSETTANWHTILFGFSVFF